MADSLLDNYNPLYDIHLRQYFALPHMQKHLQKMGLLESTLNLNGDEVYARHHAMMDMMLKNREAQLMKMAELRKKLDAAEKVEICRRIRSGQSPESYRRGKPSRSLSRSRAAQKSGRQRRFSNSFEDKDFVQHIEEQNADPSDYDTRDPYKRLSANAKRFNYLHKLDDPTLVAYKDNLKKQLQRLERFREISFGPHSVARQPPPQQASWFFRRRSIMSMRGRKPIASTGNKTNAGHDSRTSCPPTTRKRRDSNPRLPPISGSKPKTMRPSPSGTASKLPPTGKKQSPSRGRPINKRLTTSTKTIEQKTVLPPVTGHAIIGGAAIATAAAIPVQKLISEKPASPEPIKPQTLPQQHSPDLETQKTFDRSSPSDEARYQEPSQPPSPEVTLENRRPTPAASPVDSHDENHTNGEEASHVNEAFSDGDEEIGDAKPESLIASPQVAQRENGDNFDENVILKPESPDTFSVADEIIVPHNVEDVITQHIVASQNTSNLDSDSESEPEYAEEDKEELAKDIGHNIDNYEHHYSGDVPELKIDQFNSKEPSEQASGPVSEHDSQPMSPKEENEKSEPINSPEICVHEAQDNQKTEENANNEQNSQRSSSPEAHKEHDFITDKPNEEVHNELHKNEDHSEQYQYERSHDNTSVDEEKIQSEEHLEQRVEEDSLPNFEKGEGIEDEAIKYDVHQQMEEKSYDSIHAAELKAEDVLNNEEISDTIEIPEREHESPEPEDHLSQIEQNSPEPQRRSPEVDNHSVHENHTAEIEQHSPNRQNHSPEVEHRTPEIEHHSPKLDHHSPELEHHTVDLEHRSPELEHHSPELEHHTVDNEHHSPELEHHSSELEHHTVDNEHHSPELEHHSPELEHHTVDLEHHTTELERHTSDIDYSSPNHDHPSPGIEQTFESADIRVDIEKNITSPRDHFTEAISQEADSEAAKLINEALTDAPALLEMAKNYEDQHPNEAQQEHTINDHEQKIALDPDHYELNYDGAQEVHPQNEIMTSIYEENSKIDSNVADDVTQSRSSSPEAQLASEPAVSSIPHMEEHDWVEKNKHIHQVTTENEFVTESGDRVIEKSEVISIRETNHEDNDVIQDNQTHEMNVDNGSSESLVIHDSPDQMIQSIYQQSESADEHVEEHEYDDGNKNIHEVIKTSEIFDEHGVTKVTQSETVISTMLKSGHEDDSANNNGEKEKQEIVENTNGNINHESATSGIPTGGIIVDDEEEENVSSI
ncbi:unnamed protein product [Caenorhabditis bovis]|uniref:Uncharacterized protein n=1 Tax=Caenorhabditis bovis TaxID=2654633 RepID=A0A8S1EJ60_9PELO|nr:unnamed protein product [Caenorhabditis bovis]